MSGTVYITISGVKRLAKSGENVKDWSSVETSEDSAVRLEIKSWALWLGPSTVLSNPKEGDMLQTEPNPDAGPIFRADLAGELCGKCTYSSSFQLKTGSILFGKNSEFYIYAPVKSIPRVTVFANSASVKPEGVGYGISVNAGFSAEIITSKVPAPVRIPSAAAISTLIEWAEKLGFAPDKSNLPADLSITLDSPKGIPEKVNIRLLLNGSEKYSGEFTKNESFYVPGLAAGKYALEISADGFENYSDLSLELSTGEIKSLAASLAPLPESAFSGTISGLVLDKEKQPVSGARVTFEKYKTESDVGGAFKISGLAPGSGILMADAEGYDIWAREIAVSTGNTAQVTAVLAKSAAESGATAGDLLVYVRDEAGRAISGATVKVFGENLSSPPDSPTGETGAAIFPDLKAGLYNVVVRANGFREGREEVETKAGVTSEVIITMEK